MPIIIIILILIFGSGNAIAMGGPWGCGCIPNVAGPSPPSGQSVVGIYYDYDCAVAARNAAYDTQVHNCKVGCTATNGWAGQGNRVSATGDYQCYYYPQWGNGSTICDEPAPQGCLMVYTDPADGSYGTASMDGGSTYECDGLPWTAEVTAIANEGYRFVYWSGVATGTSPTISVSVSSIADSVTAYFQEIDMDHDGIDDEYDLCPETAEGAFVVPELGGNPEFENYVGCSCNQVEAVKGITYLIGCDFDGDGIPNDNDKCQGSEYGIATDGDGCTCAQGSKNPVCSDADGDGVPDAEDWCPNTPAGAEVGPAGCTTGNWDDDTEMGAENPQDLNVAGEQLTELQSIDNKSTAMLNEQAETTEELKTSNGHLSSIAGQSQTATGHLGSMNAKLGTMPQDIANAMGYKGPSSEGIGLSVAAAIEVSDNASVTDTGPDSGDVDSDAAVSESQGVMQGILDSIGVDPNVFATDYPSPVEELTTPTVLDDTSRIDTFIQTVVDNNPLNAVKDMSTITYTGECTLSLPVGAFGSITWSACEWQPQIQAIGIVMQGYCAFSCFLLVAGYRKD